MIYEKKEEERINDLVPHKHNIVYFRANIQNNLINTAKYLSILIIIILHLINNLISLNNYHLNIDL